MRTLPKAVWAAFYLLCFLICTSGQQVPTRWPSGPPVPHASGLFTGP